jgi:hypothetical protein
MSWQIEIPIIVRTLINDLGDQPSYSDDRLLQVIAVAAKYVQFDVNLDHKYEINVANPNITPDPIDNRDEIFISLLSLKAACLVDQSSFRTKAAMEGIRASLGSASLSVNGQTAAWKTILDQGPCALYDELTSHWDVKDASAIKAIFSPFVGNKFDSRYIQGNVYRNRDTYS